MRVPKIIVVATDGKRTSAVALAAGGDIARRSGASLHVLHVWGDPYAGFLNAEASPEELAAAAESVLAAAKEQARALGLPEPRTHAEQGIRGEVILRFAARHGADLIVVGGRAPSVPADMLTTRVSRGVVRRSRVPALLVPSCATWPPSRVVGALEGPADATWVAPAAVRAAQTLDADLQITHVTTPGAHDSDGEIRMSINASLAHLGLDVAPLEVSTPVGGSVARTLFDIGRHDGGSLLVIGMRDARTLFYEGRQSIAEGVTRHACGPLLLVPEPSLPAHSTSRRSRLVAQPAGH